MLNNDDSDNDNDQQDIKQDNDKLDNTNLNIITGFHSTNQRIEAVYNEIPYKKEKLVIPNNGSELQIAIKQHKYWNKFFEIKTLPSPDDWLYRFPLEKIGQTFNSFYKYIKKGRQCKIYNILSSKLKHNSHNIGLITVGSFNIYLTNKLYSLFDILSEITNVYYFGINIRIINSIPLTNITSRCNSNSNMKQLLTGSISSSLRKIIKKENNLCCLMGISLIDLYPNESWNFVFGEASVNNCVGIFSFARYLPCFNQISINLKYIKNKKTKNKLNKLKSMLNGNGNLNQLNQNWFNEILTETEQILFIRRCIAVLVHEIGHLWGLNHCSYFECVMNGANHLQESDAAPLYLCPICLHKLYFLSLLMNKSKPQIQYLNILTRYQKLSNLFAKYGLIKESKWYKNRSKFIFEKLAINKNINNNNNDNNTNNSDISK